MSMPYVCCVQLCQTKFGSLPRTATSKIVSLFDVTFHDYLVRRSKLVLFVTMWHKGGDADRR